MNGKISIAIDGPAGAGKSTIAKKVAGELGYTYIDTGAIYRTMAYYFISRGMDVSDEVSVSSLCDRIKVGIKYIDGAQHVFLGETDVSDRIRTSEVGAGASKISAYPAVRASLLGLQRDMAENDNVVMDGRDIGSVVKPRSNQNIPALFQRGCVDDVDFGCVDGGRQYGNGIGSRAEDHQNHHDDGDDADGQLLFFLLGPLSFGCFVIP